jgi:hypothetical protein
MIRHVCTLNHKVFAIVFLHFVLLNMITLELLVCGWCQLVHPFPMLTVD